MSKAPIRVEWEGTTYRLYPDCEAAQRQADLIANGALERFRPLQHDSGLGWVIEDRESGRMWDAGGSITWKCTGPAGPTL